MAVRTFLTENHQCILDYEQFAESFVREELTEIIGCNPDRLLTSFQDTMFMDVAFRDIRDGIIDGDVDAKVNMVCVGDKVGRTITREGFALSVAPASVGLTENVIRTLDQARHSPSNSVLKYGAKVLEGLGELDALTICRCNPYDKFGSDMEKAIVSEFADRTYCIDRPEYDASLGAAILAIRYGMGRIV